MGLVAVSLRRPGRPKAAAKTVRILRSGIARLSPDLCNIDTKFHAFIDKNKKRVILKMAKDDSGNVLRMWFSSDAAKSGLMSFTSVLRELNLDAKQVAGVYAAKVRKQTITVYLSRKVA